MIALLRPLQAATPTLNVNIGGVSIFPPIQLPRAGSPAAPQRISAALREEPKSFPSTDINNTLYL